MFFLRRGRPTPPLAHALRSRRFFCNGGVHDVVVQRERADRAGVRREAGTCQAINGAIPAST